MSITTEQVAVLNSIQNVIGAGNAERGFHQEGDALRSLGDLRGLRTYYGEKLMLVVSEVAEAHEELRNGRAIDETYPNPDKFTVGPEDSFGNPSWVMHKPEGVPSEIADVVIRCFDFADEAGIDLGAMIAEKLDYNATRERLHGKRF